MRTVECPRKVKSRLLPASRSISCLLFRQSLRSRYNYNQRKTSRVHRDVKDLNHSSDLSRAGLSRPHIRQVRPISRPDIIKV